MRNKRGAVKRVRVNWTISSQALGVLESLKERTPFPLSFSWLVERAIFSQYGNDARKAHLRVLETMRRKKAIQINQISDEINELEDREEKKKEPAKK